MPRRGGGGMALYWLCHVVGKKGVRVRMAERLRGVGNGVIVVRCLAGVSPDRPSGRLPGAGLVGRSDLQRSFNPPSRWPPSESVARLHAAADPPRDRLLSSYLAPAARSTTSGDASDDSDMAQNTMRCGAKLRAED